MSLMDKIKEFFSGGSSAGEPDHSHAGDDRAGRDQMGAGREATAPPAGPAGMTAPSPAPGTVAMPEPMQPDAPERRDDL